MARLYGIDVSEIQGTNINWNTVKSSGIEVAILRCHQLYGIDGAFEINYKNAKAAGIKVGVYKYSYANSVAEAQAEADAVLKVLKGKKLDFPVFYDVESDTQAAMPKSTVASMIKAFLDKIEAAGYIPGVYCNLNWYSNILDRSLLPTYEYWIANYPYRYADDGTPQERLKPNAGVGWQYTECGKVPGINGEVDRDLFFKTYENYSKDKAKAEAEEEAVVDANSIIVENAVKWMERMAADNSHGYDQIYRWGELGDYDCSSAVITAYQQAGIPVKASGATYTGNMYDVFRRCGFRDVTSTVNLSTGAGMVRGDVLLNHVHHVAMHCGNGMEVEASINEMGTATGGTPGDQTGREFLKQSYRNYPWNCVLRLGNGAATKVTPFKATGTATSTVDDLYVRATPNYGVVIGQINAGDRVSVDGKVDGLWTHVNVAGIGQGYIYSQYLKMDVPAAKPTETKKPEATKPATTPKPVEKPKPAKKPTNTIKNKQDKYQHLFVGKVTADELCVRTWAGTEFPLIQSYPVLLEGNQVDVMNFTQKDSTGAKWYYVRIENGRYASGPDRGRKRYVYGFCHSGYIKKDS